MAQNYIQEGHVLDYTVPSGVTINTGDGVLVGTIFGVALGSGTAGQQVRLQTEGMFLLPKKSGNGSALTLGGAVYWDNTDKRVTGVTSGNTLVGKAWQAAADNVNTPVRVLLANGI